MPLYHYRAINFQGQYQTGEWFGLSKTDLYHHLHQQKLHLLSCQTVKKFKNYNLFLKRIKIDDLIELCHHLYQMEQVKISLLEALLLFVENYSGRYLKSVLLTIYDSLQQGFILSNACRLYPSVFDTIFVETIALAEKTGEFGQAFKNLEIYLARKKDYQQQLKQALRYPFILMVGLILLGFFMGGVFLPQFHSQLSDLGNQPLSFASRSLIQAVATINEYGIPLLSGTLVIYLVGFFLYKISNKFQEFINKLVLKIPLIGAFKKRILLNKFTQTLGLLLNANISLLNSLDKAIICISNKFLKKELTKVYEDVQAGLKLSQALQKTKLLSPVLQRYIQLGEETGNLGLLIQQAADFDLKQILRRLQLLLAWTEPTLIVMIGCILMWIVMATIVPLYDSLSDFKG